MVVAFAGLLPSTLPAQEPDVLRWWLDMFPYHAPGEMRARGIYAATYYHRADLARQDSLREAAGASSFVVVKPPPKVFEVLFNRDGHPTDIIAYVQDPDPDDVNFHWKYRYDAQQCLIETLIGESALPRVPWQQETALRHHCDALGRNDTLTADDFGALLFGFYKRRQFALHYDRFGRIALREQLVADTLAPGTWRVRSTDSLVYARSGRLARIYTRPAGEPARLAESYGYDAQGRCTEVRHDFGEFEGRVRWAYDADGKPVQRIWAPRSGGRTQVRMRYSEEGLLQNFRLREDGEDLDLGVVYEGF